MRQESFKMERPGLVKPGDKVQITEYQSYMNYSYIIEPAVAMSGCYPNSQRIKAKEGTIVSVEKAPLSGYVVIAEFEVPLHHRCRNLIYDVPDEPNKIYIIKTPQKQIIQYLLDEILTICFRGILFLPILCKKYFQNPFSLSHGLFSCLPYFLLTSYPWRSFTTSWIRSFSPTESCL